MTARDRTIILVVAIFGALAAGFLLVVKPRQDHAAKLGGQVTQQRRAVADAHAQVQAAERAKVGYHAAFQTLARLGEAVPTDVNEPSLVYQLNGAAKGTGVDFRALKLTGTGGAAPGSAGAAAPGQASAGTTPPNAVAGASVLDTMPFNLTFDGSFFRMSDFFHRLERYVVAQDTKNVTVAGRLLQIDGVSLSASRNGFPQVKASVAATAFLLPAGQTPTAGGTPSAPAAGGQPASQTTTNGASGSTPAPAATATPLRP